ncbi:hypothetical protein FRX31_034460 [Thalictrum thalictroides]|uniref:Uncharacterized protein n=1 Tax=Thalictrum thalictroides TaxID=46969 RepID=A0A7J6UUN5_THATH|nr:hypothetical protein FRX31_034460 [Thalictrum thalictroides]
MFDSSINCLNTLVDKVTSSIHDDDEEEESDELVAKQSKLDDSRKGEESRKNGSLFGRWSSNGFVAVCGWSSHLE